MSRMLVVVDVQNDFCEGGSLAVEGGNDVARKIDLYIAWVGQSYKRVVATKDWHINPGTHWSDNPDFIDSWPKHCEANTDGSDFNNDLDFADFDSIFYKGQYDAAYSGFEGREPSQNLSLADYARANEITEIDVCGLAFDYCVRATALDAAEHGFKVRVLLTLTEAVRNDPDHLNKILAEFDVAGITYE